MRYTRKQLEILRTIRGDTHSIWMPSFTNQVGKAFKFGVVLRSYKDEGGVFKGVELHDPTKECMGLDSELLVCQIAKHIGYKFLKAMEYNGRGTRVRAMAEELIDLPKELRLTDKAISAAEFINEMIGKTERKPKWTFNGVQWEVSFGVKKRDNRPKTVNNSSMINTAKNNGWKYTKSSV